MQHIKITTKIMQQHGLDSKRSDFLSKHSSANLKAPQSVKQGIIKQQKVKEKKR